jgi:hypothetical protein
MDSARTPTSLDAHLSALVDAAIAKGAPIEVARDARAATMRAMGPAGISPARARRRAEAYFWAVIRRRLVRLRAPSDATARFVLAAVVEDLLASGRGAADVWTELERGWSDKVPGDVLEEFRLRMCA